MAGTCPCPPVTTVLSNYTEFTGVYLPKFCRATKIPKVFFTDKFTSKKMDQPTRPIGSIIFQKVCFGVLTFALLARKLESFQDLNFRSGIETDNTFHKDGTGLLSRSYLSRSTDGCP